MIFEDCPLTKHLQIYWRSKIWEVFPLLKNTPNGDYLSIYKYLKDTPERFYIKQVSEDYFDFLTELKRNQPKTLKDILVENEDSLSLALRNLREINALNFHDDLLSSEHNELIMFINTNIHSNYLKLTEGVYFVLIYPIAKMSRLSRKVATDGLDVFNCVDEIRNTNFCNLSEVFNNTIRNGIAHGKIIFKEHEIVYLDKKGNSESIPTNDIIKKFDDMLDFCNSMALSLKLFYFSNLQFLENEGVRIPHSLMIEELQSKANSPGWEIIDCLDSIDVNNRKQLVLYTRNKFLNFDKLRYYVFRTAVLTEKYSPGYERYFLSLNSRYALPGWAAFDGILLKNLRLRNENSIVEYAKSLEDNLIFFVPKIKLPRFIFKISNMLSAFKAIMPMAREDYLNKYFPDPFVIRDVRIHRNGLYSVIRDARVIIKSEFQSDIQELIRKRSKLIIRKCIKQARKTCKLMQPLKYLLVGYIRVSVYTVDYRKRRLGNVGLAPELICSIEFKRLKRVKTIDLLRGIAEAHGKYRIVWNKNWLDFAYPT